jgi:hypothetical protein
MDRERFSTKEEKIMAKKTNSDLYVDNDMWNDLCSIQGYNAIEMLADIIKESTEHG